MEKEAKSKNDKSKKAAIKRTPIKDLKLSEEEMKKVKGPRGAVAICRDAWLEAEPWYNFMSVPLTVIVAREQRYSMDTRSGLPPGASPEIPMQTFRMLSIVAEPWHGFYKNYIDCKGGRAFSLRVIAHPYMTVVS